MLPLHNDEVLSWADYVPQETLFWQRTLWDRAGGYIDERFVLCLDWDLLLRFREPARVLCACLASWVRSAIMPVSIR